jgi:hypothetical protein
MACPQHIHGHMACNSACKQHATDFATSVAHMIHMAPSGQFVAELPYVPAPAQNATAVLSMQAACKGTHRVGKLLHCFWIDDRV